MLILRYRDIIEDECSMIWEGIDKMDAALARGGDMKEEEEAAGNFVVQFTQKDGQYLKAVDTYKMVCLAPKCVWLHQRNLRRI
jgi:hypothetical protein